MIHTQEKNYSNWNRYTNDLGIASRRQELQSNYDKYVKESRGKDGLNGKRDEEFQEQPGKLKNKILIEILELETQYHKSINCRKERIEEF